MTDKKPAFLLMDNVYVTEQDDPLKFAWVTQDKRVIKQTKDGKPDDVEFTLDVDKTDAYNKKYHFAKFEDWDWTNPHAYL